jgi:hypothetical protein
MRRFREIVPRIPGGINQPYVLAIIVASMQNILRCALPSDPAATALNQCEITGSARPRPLEIVLDRAERHGSVFLPVPRRSAN